MRAIFLSTFSICFLSSCAGGDWDEQLHWQSTQQALTEQGTLDMDTEVGAPGHGIRKPPDCFDICAHSSCGTSCWDWRTTVCGRSEMADECTDACRKICGYYTPCGRSCWQYGNRTTCGNAGYDCAPDDDWDRDGVKNNVDNCIKKPNKDQKNIDCDDKGDACDNKDDYIYNDCRDKAVNTNFYNARTLCCKNRYEEFVREYVDIDWVKECKVKRCYGSPPYNIRWQWKVIDSWTDYLTSDCYNGWPCDPKNNNTKYYSCLR